MKKHLLIGAVIASFAVAVAFSCKKADDQAKKEEEAKPVAEQKQLVSIKKTIDAAAKSGVVQFDHEAHKKRATANGKNCQFCHHKGKVTDKCATDKCHLGKDGEKMLHKSCIEKCHSQAPNAPKKADCAKCHAKI